METIGVSSVPQKLEDISQEWLRANVLQQEIREDFVVLNHRVTCATKSEDPDGILSLMVQIETEVELTNSGERKRFDLFGKLFPLNQQHRKLVRKLRAFEREIHVYSSLHEQIIGVQKSPLKLEPFWPRCVYSIVDGENNIGALVMEDLKASGFKLMDKTRELDFDYLKLCMKALAQTHALTFNLKMQLGVEEMLIQNQQLLDKPMLNFDDLFEIRFGLAIHFVRGYGRPDLAEKMEIYRQKHGGKVMPYVNLLLDRPHRMRTLSQGDCWINNMMFRHEIEDGKEFPVEVKLIDLQIVRYTHPCVDLAYFLFGASSSHQRRPIDQLLRMYYDTFFSILREVGSSFSLSDYTYEEFKADFQLFRNLGLVFGITFIIVQLSDPKETPNMDDMEQDFSTMWQRWLEQQKNKPVPEDIGYRLVDLVEDASLHGIL